MTHQVKALAIILFCSLLTLTTQVSVAQSEAAEQKANQADQENKNAVNIDVININNSTLEQLSTLKGVGKKKAYAIIAYRQRAGKFKKVNDLLNVKGIGTKIIKDNEIRLTI
jgi:competence protein ComEA